MTALVETGLYDLLKRLGQIHMPYRYDVFFSYKRDAESDEWHEKVKNKIIYWLKHELNRLDVEIFFDTEEIRTGARWRTKIYDALRTSKTMVCVWSPQYFESRWCLSEWKTFAEREKRGGCELVVPASYHDGDHFPDEAKELQIKDLSDYASTMPAF